MNHAETTEHDQHGQHGLHRITDESTVSRPSTQRIENGETPEAVQEAAFAHEKAKAALAKARGRGVEWVRPTDLIARQSSRLAHRGIDLHAELARRARTVTGVERLSQRVRRLPPVSAFGRHGANQSGPVRSGVGMR